MTAMDDFMSNVDRRPILLEREVDNIDGPVDSGAKPTWIGKIDLHNRSISLTNTGPLSHPQTHRTLLSTLRQSSRFRQLNWPAPSLLSVLTQCILPRRLTQLAMSSPASKKILIVEDERDILQ